MHINFLIFLLSMLGFQSFSQQLYFEGFTGRNLTQFSESPYKDSPTWFTPAGVRVAVGADRIQMGAEYHKSILNPSWNIDDDAGMRLGNNEFTTTYYGGFIRTKISKYPAMRFGLVLRAGAGIYETEVSSSVSGTPANATYDPTLGFNSGAGLSFPIANHLMFELGYTYYYIDYSSTDILPDLKASYHSIQAGLSFNFVFGKRQQEYDRIRKKRRS